MQFCSVCGKIARKRCTRCKQDFYCSSLDHQKLLWKIHKLVCVEERGIMIGKNVKSEVIIRQPDLVRCEFDIFQSRFIDVKANGRIDDWDSLSESVKSELHRRYSQECNSLTELNRHEKLIKARFLITNLRVREVQKSNKKFNFPTSSSTTTIKELSWDYNTYPYSQMTCIETNLSISTTSNSFSFQPEILREVFKAFFLYFALTGILVNSKEKFKPTVDLVDDALRRLEIDVERLEDEGGEEGKNGGGKSVMNFREFREFTSDEEE